MLLTTPICDFGWKAPNFTLKDTDGNNFTMTQHLGEKGLLIMFICNHCPYVQSIAKQLSADTAVLIEKGINVIAIMSNDYQDIEADSPANMKRFASQHAFAFPYLIDEDQAVGRAYGAVCTPDFFGLNARGELQYRGRLNDSRMNPISGRKPELLLAMQQIADTGQGPLQQFASIGCSIKWR